MSIRIRDKLTGEIREARVGEVFSMKSGRLYTVGPRGELRLVSGEVKKRLTPGKAKRKAQRRELMEALRKKR